MLCALVMAAALAAPAPTPGTDALASVRRRFEALWVDANRPRIVNDTVRREVVERIAAALQSIDEFAARPNPDATADLERLADLEERVVPALLSGTAPALDAAPGAHVGIVRAGDHDEPFEYWVPRNYDARKPPPLVVLLHGRGQPETDIVARAFFRDLADRTGTVLLAPGGDDRDANAMARSTDAAERAIARAVPTDARRRYAGGFSNGVYCAYHLVATGAGPFAGFLGIAGVLRPLDTRGAGLGLAGEGAYLVIGSDDTVIGTSAVRSSVRRLRAEHVYARYYEVARAPHALRPLYSTIAAAWSDMLAGVTEIPNDGLGIVSDTGV